MSIFHNDWTVILNIKKNLICFDFHCIYKFDHGNEEVFTEDRLYCRHYSWHSESRDEETKSLESLSLVGRQTIWKINLRARTEDEKEKEASSGQQRVKERGWGQEGHKVCVSRSVGGGERCLHSRPVTQAMLPYAGFRVCYPLNPSGIILGRTAVLFCKWSRSISVL